MSDASVAVPWRDGRLFEELTAAEARAVATTAAAELPRALDRITADVPHPAPQRVREGVIEAWSWALERVPARERAGEPPTTPTTPTPSTPSTSWSQMSEADVPYWCRFRDLSGVYGPLGPEACLVADSVGAYVVTLLSLIHPGSEIAPVSSGRGAADFRKPALRLPDGREWVMSAPYVVSLNRATDPDDRFHVRARRRDHLLNDRLWAWTRPRVSDPDAVAGEATFSVSAAGPGEFAVHVADSVAHAESDRVELLVRRLAVANGVEAARREDRDLLVVRAPDLAPDDLRVRLDELWTTG